MTQVLGQCSGSHWDWIRCLHQFPKQPNLCPRKVVGHDRGNLYRNGCRLESKTMQTSDLPMYESWNLTLPTLPTRSRLYSLVPLGIGTATVETLSSYLVRLAQAHHVSASLFIQYELAFRYTLNQQSSRLSRDAAFEASLKFWRSHPSILQNTTAENWLAVNDQVEQIVRLLEQLTLRSDLHNLTLLPLKRFFSLHKVLRSEQPWCPMCYQQWQDAEMAVHTPLLWAFEPVWVCPQHHCYTQLWCLYCHQLQPFLSRETALGYCTSCGQWLGRDLTPGTRHCSTDRDWEWHLWVAESLGQILAAMPILHRSKHQGKSPKRQHPKPDLIEFLKRCHDLQVIPVKVLFAQQNITLPSNFQA